MTREYVVTVEVAVAGDSLENAKENAINYFHQISEIRDDEVKET